MQPKFETYKALLIKWQKAINLVSPKTIKDAQQRHFEDSLQIKDLIPDNSVVADLGSGAGFPGLVLAIVRSDLKIHLIEADERKCQFLKNVSRETQTPVIIHTIRVEQILNTLNPDIITARAFAALESILEYGWECAQKNPQLQFILLKGRDASTEIEAAKNLYKFDIKSIDSVTEQGAKILIITNLQKKI
jgi:16S rRNA (guanine527-N7)-methyltransferase